MDYYANVFDLARNADVHFYGKGEFVMDANYQWDVQSYLNREIDESHYADCVYMGEWQSLTLTDVMAYVEAALRTDEGILKIYNGIERLWLEKGESCFLSIDLENLLGCISDAVAEIAGIKTRYYGSEREHQNGLYLTANSEGIISFYCRPDEAHKLARVEWNNGVVLAAILKHGALEYVRAYAEHRNAA